MSGDLGWGLVSEFIILSLQSNLVQSLAKRC
uniref:Uncharacterized protein n=1 Tax=Anguilla anguilla TaxID=7936 RepID=A0A0E9VK65_ANGAN